MAEAIPTPARYSRMNAEPYLEGEKFDSLQAAEEYLLSPVCYPSQIISVKKDGAKYYPYIINEKDGKKVLDPIMGDSGGSGGGGTDVRNAVVIPATSLPSTSTAVPVPGLVPVLQALASGETIPPVFVSVQPLGGSGLSLISPAHFELYNYTGTGIPQFYYRLEYSISNGNNPNTLQGEMRRRVMTGVGTFDGESVTLDRRTYYEEQLPYLAGSASKVLTQKGTFVDMPTSPGNATASSDGLMSKEDKAKLDEIAEGANKTVVDSALSTTSTNPVQNKAVKAALDGKQGKFSNGGTLQVSSINGNTALSAGNVDAKADYVEVQYTGSSDASFDFNNKFSANWFTDRTNKPQRMLLRNNSSGTLTVTTSGNANFSYNFIKVTIPASGYVEFLVYKSIVAVTANSNESNPLKGAIIETGHEAVCLSLSLKESGTIPSSDLAKLKEDKSRIPLFYHDGNNSNLLFPATYNWNGTKLYVQLIEPQPDNFRMTSITYSSSGVWESKKNIALDFSGDGTKFLNNKGVYAAVLGPHVVAHGMVSADGTVTFYYGEGQEVSHTTGTYRFIVTGRLTGRILLAFPMQDGFYLSQAAISGGMHTITAYKDGTKTDCDFCFIVYGMN